MRYNHKTYTLDIATKLKELEHTTGNPHWHRVYGIADIEEFAENQGITDGYQLLMEENDDNRFIDNRSDNLISRFFHAFYISKSFEGGSPDDKEEAKEACKTVAKKVISKYLRDYKTDAALPKSNWVYGLAQLEPESFSMRTIPPMGDNYISVYVSFTLLDTADVVYDSGDWNE